MAFRLAGLWRHVVGLAAAIAVTAAGGEAAEPNLQPNGDRSWPYGYWEPKLSDNDATNYTRVDDISELGDPNTRDYIWLHWEDRGKGDEYDLAEFDVEDPYYTHAFARGWASASLHDPCPPAHVARIDIQMYRAGDWREEKHVDIQTLGFNDWQYFATTDWMGPWSQSSVNAARLRVLGWPHDEVIAPYLYLDEVRLVLCPCC